MISVYVPEVGDGLAAGIQTVGNSTIEIDCGSEKTPGIAYHRGIRRIRPNVFFLSHFHSDHYNGLFERETSFVSDVRRLYLPRLPDFKERKDFIKCMTAMNHLLLGDTTGSPEFDFISVMTDINGGHRPGYERLSSGQKVQTNGTELSILWPPRAIQNDALSAIKTAISTFETAMEKDTTLRHIYESLEENEIDTELYTDDEQNGEAINQEKSNMKRTHHGKEEQPLKLREEAIAANKSLRDAANHLSLAFYEDNRFLFLGDLESSELKQIADDLLRANRDRFLVLITPHHGTHWHDALRNLRVWWAISSVGKARFKFVKRQFEDIAGECLSTYLYGDIEVPYPYWYWPMALKYWRMPI